MMKLSIRMPSAAGAPSFVWISRWLVNEGDKVEPGQTVLEVMSNGVIEAVRSAYCGFVTWIISPEDSVCHAGKCLYVMTDCGDGFTNRGGPRFKLRSSAWRHAQMALLAQYKLG